MSVLTMTTREFGSYTAQTANQWGAILDLASQWEFISIKNLAIKHLTSLASPIEKIVIGRKHGIYEWLNDAYEDVCLRRSESLSLDEGLKLGMEDVIKISSLRCQIARERFKRCPALSTLIAVTFELKPRSQVMNGENESFAVESPEVQPDMDEAMNATSKAVFQEPNIAQTDGGQLNAKQRKKLRKLERAMERQKMEAEQADNSAVLESKYQADEGISTKESD